MAKLLGTEKHGHITDKYWLHTGDGGKDVITVETVEDVEPVFDKVKDRASNRYKDMKYLASIPSNVMNEMSKIKAKEWGIRPREAFRELIQNDTNRANLVWKDLVQGRTYRKLQAKNY